MVKLNEIKRIIGSEISNQEDLAEQAARCIDEKEAFIFKEKPFKNTAFYVVDSDQGVKLTLTRVTEIENDGKVTYKENKSFGKSVTLPAWYVIWCIKEGRNYLKRHSTKGDLTFVDGDQNNYHPSNLKFVELNQEDTTYIKDITAPYNKEYHIIRLIENSNGEKEVIIGTKNGFKEYSKKYEVYLMETKLGRYLNTYKYSVWFKDCDFTNYDIDNLEIMTNESYEVFKNLVNILKSAGYELNDIRKSLVEYFKINEDIIRKRWFITPEDYNRIYSTEKIESDDFSKLENIEN